MRKIYLEDRNNVLSGLVSQFEVTTNMAKADVYLTWNDILPQQRSNIKVAQAHGIPTIMMEHGMGASHDYLKDLEDGQTLNHGMDFMADYYLAWGDYGKDNMLKSGVEESKIRVVGSPAIREVKYTYGVDGAEIDFNSYQGDSLKDPVTGKYIHLIGRKEVIVKRKKKALVIYFPHHDFIPLAIEKCQQVYDQIKHRKDLFIKSTASYKNTDKRNPFLDWVIEPEGSEIEKEAFRELRTKNILFISPNITQNQQLVLNLLSVASCIVTDIPGTINGIAASVGVPCVVPKVDFLLRRDGKVIYNELESDYLCELEDLDSTIDFAISHDDKEEARNVVAKKYMGNDKNPYVEVKKVIDEICDNKL